MQQRSLPERDPDQKNTSDALAEASAFRDAMLNASGLAIITTDPDACITTCNATAERLLGHAAADVIGKPLSVIFQGSRQSESHGEKAMGVPEQNIKSALADFKEAHSLQQQRDISFTFTRGDGSQFATGFSLICIRDAQKKITGYAGIFTDVSAQEKLREQIIVSERKFQLLAENIPGAIYLCHNDAQYTVIYINDHIENITGYSAEDFRSGKIMFADLFHPEDKDLIRQTINECVSKRKSFNLRYRMRHASKEWRWVEESGAGVFEGEQLTILEGFLQDVTLQKEAEEKLQAIAEENLRFFNNPVNLNAVWDFNGNLRRISPSWTKMLGWTEAELKSKPVMDFVHPDDVEQTRMELKYISRATKVHTFENRFACKDGSYRWLLWGSASDPQTKMIYASAVDISARKESEEHILDSKSNLEGITLQLQEQNRRLDEFAHIISHNLRAPVNNIQALINLLDEKSEISDYKLIFEKLNNVAKNLRETMNELMDTLKARTQSNPDLTEIRFREVLDKVVQSLEGELIVAQADVTFDFNETPTIHYSKPYLESIFQNLLTNAIKYRSPVRKPSIHFRSYKADNHQELQVTDNGIGIDMDKFGDMIFGLHKTFHDHKEARGVGLFLVKTQIEALGGTISIKSEVDKGTTFTIRFN